MPVARPSAVGFTVKVTVVAEVVAVPDIDEAVSQLGTPEIAKLTAPVVALSWNWNDPGAKGPPFFPEERGLPAGVTCRVGTGTLTDRVAVRVVLPRPLVVLVNVMVVGP